MYNVFMFETEIIRVLVYISGAYALLSSAHQILVTELFGFDSWLTNAVDSGTVSTTLLVIGILVGLAVIAAAFLNKRKTLLWSLGALTAFEFTLAIINVWDTLGQGTPVFPALACAAVAAMLWSYYRLQPDGLEKQDEMPIEEEILGKIKEEDELL